MSSDDNKQTGQAVTTSNLLPAAGNALSTSLSSAQNLFNTGALFQPYGGSLVTPYSGNTTMANDAISSRVGNASSILDRNFQNVAGMGDNPLSGAQRSAMDTLSGIASGSTAIGTGGLYDQIGRDANGSYSESNLAKYANGSMMGQANPAFDAILKRSQEDATNAVGMGASAAGRYGSGIAQGNVAREVGNVTNQALLSRLAQDESNMFSANSLLDAQRQGNLGTRLNAAAGLTGVNSQGVQDRMAAAGGLFGFGQQEQQNRLTAAGMLPSLYDSTLDPYRAQLGVGAAEEAMATDMTNDQLRRTTEQRDQQRKAVEWLNAIATGTGNLGGTSTQTAYAPKTSPFLAGLGGAVSGYGSGGLGGAALGGGLGLLGSFL